MQTAEERHAQAKKCGDATRKKFYDEFPDAFWAKVKRGSINDCWPWTGEFNNRGYGVVVSCHEKHVAHRWAWIFLRGSIPEGLIVMHKCDNRPCCNPLHLKLGTNKENSEDMVNKGRCKNGERHYNAKLNSEKVVEIRKALAAGCTAVSMARRYGVSDRTIREVRDRLIWKHVL